MKIAVLLKPIPDLANLSISKSNQCVYEKGPRIFNPSDRNALEMALLVSQHMGGTIQVLTMGEESNEPILREALAMGAHEAYLLVDESFQGSDGWAISHILSSALEKIGNLDLVFCSSGTQASLPGEIGGRLAQSLGLPFYASLSEIIIENKELWAAYTDLEIPSKAKIHCPSLITVMEGANTPRIVNALKIMKAAKAPIIRWNADALELDKTQVGESGSALRVYATYLSLEDA